MKILSSKIVLCCGVILAFSCLFSCNADRDELKLQNSLSLPLKTGPFSVTKIYADTYAISESARFESVTCYLLVGSKKALLFDTGLGIGNIRDLVKKITTRPVMVVNSHSHYDHVGGNYLFENVYAPDLPFTQKSARGMTHAAFVDFYTFAYMSPPDSCEGYRIHPYEVSHNLEDGDVINIGGREVCFRFTPGHSGDDLIMIDEHASVLFVGDTYYDGALFLHLKESSLAEYTETAVLLNRLADRYTYICPAHSKPMVRANQLKRVNRLLESIRNGTAKVRRLRNNYLYMSDSLRIVLPGKYPR